MRVYNAQRRVLVNLVTTGATLLPIEPFSIKRFAAERRASRTVALH